MPNYLRSRPYDIVRDIFELKQQVKSLRIGNPNLVVPSLGDHVTAWINICGPDYNADNTGVSATDGVWTQAFAAATATGVFSGTPCVVYAPAGIYKTMAPVTPPPGVTIIGDFSNNNTTYTDFAAGTIIQPDAGWTAGSNPWNGIITILGQSDGGWAVVGDEMKVIGVYIDGHNLTTGTADGIQLYGGTGRFHAIDSLISHCPNNGFNCVADGSGNSSGSYRLDHVNVRYAGNVVGTGVGFVLLKNSDCSVRDCLAENCAGDGYQMTNMSNGIMYACRAEHNGTSGVGNGYTYICTNSSTGSGTLLMVGCSTDRNEAYGLSVSTTNASGVPVQVVGCRFRRDGRNGGTGGGGFAGVNITGYPSSVTLVGSSVFTGVNDGYPSPAETNSPAYGVKMTGNSSATTISISGCHIQGATMPFLDDGSGKSIYGGGNTFAFGTTGSPTTIPSGPVFQVGPPSGDTTGAGDTNLIAGAIAQASAVGGTVQLMAGAGYQIKSPIDPGGVTFSGCGAAAVIIQGSAWSGTGIFKPSSTCHITNVNALGSSSAVVDFNNNFISNIEIDHCTFEGTGGHVFTNPNLHQSWIHHCQFSTGGSNAGNYGIWNQGTSGSGVSTTVFESIISTVSCNSSTNLRTVPAWAIQLSGNKVVDVLRFNNIECFNTANGTGGIDNSQYHFDICCTANASAHDFDRIWFTKCDGGNVLGGFIRVMSCQGVILDRCSVGNVFSQGTPSVSTTNSFIYIGTWNGGPVQAPAAYNSGTAYSVNQFVTFSGNVYQCISATTGNAPSGTTSNNTWWDYTTQGPTGTPANGTPCANILITGYMREGSGISHGAGNPSDIECTSDTTNGTIIQGGVPDTGNQPQYNLHGALGWSIWGMSSGAVIQNIATDTIVQQVGTGLSVGGGPVIGMNALPKNTKVTSVTGTTSTTDVMAGCGVTYKPTGTGNILITVTGLAATATAAAQVQYCGAYGTGTAPTNGATATGTRYGATSTEPKIGPASAANAFMSWMLTDVITGLTPGTTYWFDIRFATGTAADQANLSQMSFSIAEH
jgi:hypothetical protein